jgi:enoyl-CoA hydratase/carnithine racemase
MPIIQKQCSVQERDAKMTISNPYLTLNQEGAVATVTLNRPEKHNAWHPQMGLDLQVLVRGLGDDASVRVIVITGAGKTFCAGLDMDYMRDVQAGRITPVPDPGPGSDDLNQRYSYLMGIPKPVICAINGPAVGIGLVLALFCDIRFAASSARFSAMFSRRGLIPEHGITWLLPRMIGLPRAIEMMMSGRMVNATEAERLGLVNECFDDMVFRAEVAQRAQDLAENSSPRSNRIIKRLTYEATTSSLTEAVHASYRELPGTLASDDFREGVQHFIEKRPPRFTGN